MKEYGGFLPFELQRGSEYFDKYENEFAICRLNCGRSAFWYAAGAIQPEKVYLPYFNCLDNSTVFERLGIPYEYYRLDDDLLPKDIMPQEKEAVLWVNYYGDASKEKVGRICDRYRDTNLIIDNCHAFYMEPVHGAYNCYSARKFFGVCDGAYLVADELPELPLKRGSSVKYCSFILESVEVGTNKVYEKNLENEKRMTQEVDYQMSVVTQKILQPIHYEEIRRIRQENFLELHKYLGNINEFDVNLQSYTYICYPLLVSNPSLRERLIQNRVYTPTWWRHVPEYFNKDVLESHLSRYMVMLPIDQRYDKNDMRDIANIVIRENQFQGNILK